MEESSPLAVSQRLNRETVVLKKLPQLLQEKLNINPEDFLLLSAFVGYIYDFKLVNVTESDSHVPSSGASQAQNFLDILDILRTRYNLKDLLDLLMDDGELDPYSRSVEDYHTVVDKIIGLLGGETEGRTHILYSVADIARGDLPQDKSDQKLLSLKTKNSIDTLICLTGLSSLSGIRADLPELEEVKLSQRIKQTVTESAEAEAILKVLKVDKNAFQALLKTIFTPGLMSASSLFRALHLEPVLFGNANLKYLVDIMLKSRGSPAAYHANEDNQSFLKPGQKIPIPSTISSQAQTEVLQLALSLRSGDISALYDYPNHKFHIPSQREESAKLLSITSQLLALINPRSSRPLYDTFRALMVEIGNQNACNAIKLAGLDMSTLLDIQETCGILKQALAGVLLSIEQFPCNMKAVWIERAVLKKIRGHDGFALQEHYSEQDYIDQAGYLETGRDVDYKNTERDYYETSVFNKFANYGYRTKIDLLKEQFGLPEEDLGLFLGKDETEYYQHFANVWGQDLNESQLIYKVDTEEAEIPKKKIDLITLKKQKEGSRPGSPVLSTDSVKGPFSACAGSLRRRWTKDADRDFVENIWKGMVVPLTKMGNVLVGDLIFAFHILALREIARNPEKVRKDRNAYNKMLHRIDDIIHYIELQGLTSGALSESFDKYRLVKLIGMTLGVKVSAKAELWFLESVSSQFKKELVTNQENKQELKRDEVLEQTILHQQVGYEWNEIVDFYKNQRDAQDLQNLYHQCFPYQRESMLDQEKEYDRFDPSQYQISRWIKQHLEKAENPRQEIARLREINAALMFKTMSLSQKMIGTPPPHRDPCSGLPIKDVLDYFRVLQQYLVVESQTYELLLGLSEGDLNTWVGAYPFLKATNTLHQDTELELGNSVMQLLSLRSQFQAAIRNKFQSGDAEDWEVPDAPEEEQGAEEEKVEQEKKEENTFQEPQPETQMPLVEEAVAPLLQGIKTSVEHLSEVLVYCLGSPNSHSYDKIQVALQLTPEILQLLHTSGFALSRVIIPSLRGDFDYPVEGMEDDEEEERINEVVEQYSEFSDQLSIDEPRPFSTRVLSGLAFLPYNRKLALKKLFLQEDRAEQGEQQGAQETPRLATPENQRESIGKAPLSLTGLFKLIHFDLEQRRAKERDRRLSAQVPITRSNFYEASSKLQKFQKDFIFDLPDLIDSIHQQSTQRQLIVSHILVGLVQAVGLDCIEDAITTLNFLQNSNEVDSVLYDYIQQLIFERFDMLEVKTKLEQLRKFDRAGEEDPDEEIKFEDQNQAPPPQKDVFDKKNQGGKMQPLDQSPFKPEGQSGKGAPETIERVTILPKDLKDKGDTKEEVKAIMPQKLVEAGGNEKSMVKAILGEEGVDASFDSAKSNKASAQPAPRIQSKVEAVKISSKEEKKEDKKSMSNLIQRFESRSILKISDDGYSMSILGVIDGKYSILKLFQACIRFSDIFDIKDEEDRQAIERRINAPRSTLVSPIQIERKLKFMKSECILQNAQFRRFNLTIDTITPPMKCELVYPASSEQIMKERTTKTYMIDETSEIYHKHTVNIIENIPLSNDQWIRNILDGGHQRNRILADVPGKEGFVLVLDYKYTADMPDSMFHAVAIPRWPGLKTIRDLRAEHVGMLNQILAVSFKAIQDEHQIASYELVAYFHYLPTYYSLHLHFTHVERTSPSLQIGKAITFRDVIQNISFKSSYYEEAILSVRLDEGHPLAQKLMQEVLEADLDEEDAEA